MQEVQGHVLPDTRCWGWHLATSNSSQYPLPALTAGVSLSWQLPMSPPPPVPFAVHRMSQQVPPQRASASALSLVQPPALLCAPRVFGSTAPHPVPQALPGAGSGGDEEAQLCLRGAR